MGSAKGSPTRVVPRGGSRGGSPQGLPRGESKEGGKQGVLVEVSPRCSLRGSAGFQQGGFAREAFERVPRVGFTEVVQSMGVRRGRPNGGAPMGVRRGGISVGGRPR